MKYLIAIETENEISALSLALAARCWCQHSMLPRIFASVRFFSPVCLNNISLLLSSRIIFMKFSIMSKHEQAQERKVHLKCNIFCCVLKVYDSRHQFDRVRLVKRCLSPLLKFLCDFCESLSLGFLHSWRSGRFGYCELKKLCFHRLPLVFINTFIFYFIFATSTIEYWGHFC